MVMIDEIDETGNIEGATKLLEFLASKQRKSAVMPGPGRPAGDRPPGPAAPACAINLSTVVYGMLARDSEARHAVGAENELPDISEYCRGEAGLLQHLLGVRPKKLIQRGAGPSTSASSAISRQKIIARRDPAARPVLKGAGEVTAPAPAAPREQAGSGLRERLAHVRELNEGHPLPAGAGGAPGGPRRAPGGRGGTGPGAGRRAALGRGGRAGPGHVQVRRSPVPGRAARGRGGRDGRRRPAVKLAARRAAPAAAPSPQPYTTIEASRPGRARRPGATRPTSSGRSWSRSGRSPTGRA